MVGQNKLIAKLKSYTNATLPHSMLFLGESGCGKHTLVSEMAKMFNLPLIDATEVLSPESIEEMKLRSVPTMYLISMDSISERAQNSLLKLVEEPGSNAYVVLISSSKYGILDTILNRCIIYDFEPYTVAELSEIVGEEIPAKVLAVTTTPGQIKVTLNRYDALMTLCATIGTKMCKARFTNALSIADKINYKDEYDKFDFYVFIKALKMSLADLYIKTNEETAIKLYNIVQEEAEKLVDSRLNKEVFMYHLLTRLWFASRGDVR